MASSPVVGVPATTIGCIGMLGRSRVLVTRVVGVGVVRGAVGVNITLTGSALAARVRSKGPLVRTRRVVAKPLGWTRRGIIELALKLVFLPLVL